MTNPSGDASQAANVEESGWFSGALSLGAAAWNYASQTVNRYENGME